MKKRISILLCACLVSGALALTSCQSSSGAASSSPAASSAPVSSSEIPISSSIEPASSSSSSEASSEASSDAAELESRKEELKEKFLKAADQVTVSEDSVTFQDASSEEPITIAKNPEKTACLYGSFTTLWYEAGGTAAGCVGGDSAIELYNEYIGRDITADEGVTVVATSSSGTKWDTEAIIALEPDLIICSTAMSGYSTIEAPAKAAGIPVIAMSYNDFSDYLKWFKVFCNLNNKPELWDSVAMKALDEVVEVITEIPEGEGPTVLSMLSGSKSLQANTTSTVLGGMIEELGGVNIVDTWENKDGAERLEVNLETVYAADPEMIMIQCHAGEETAQEQVAEIYGSNPVWQSLSAVKNDQIHYLEKSLFHNKPNSHFADAYQKLAAIMYPDATFSFQKNG